MSIIVLTGAAGFIGSHTGERLLAAGYEVLGVDNFDPFYDRAIKEANLTGLHGQSGFALVEADVTDGDAVRALFERAGAVDAIVHIAAKAGVRPSIEDPLGYEKANVRATINLLEAAAQMSPRPRFIFASSSSVYGNSRRIPFHEDDPVARPISPYAATKRSCELIAHTYHHLYDLDVWALRFFTVYGPRQRPDLAIMKFARRILTGQSVPMFGDGTSSRDYTYIDDIIDGVMAAVERCRGYELINLGSTSPITLKEMIATVASACGRTPDIEHLPMPPGDVDRTYANVEKAQRLLDFHPTTLFREGVERQVEWLREQLRAAEQCEQ